MCKGSSHFAFGVLPLSVGGAFWLQIRKGSRQVAEIGTSVPIVSAALKKGGFDELAGMTALATYYISESSSGTLVLES